MKVYNNKQELEENIFSLAIEEHFGELKETEMDFMNLDLENFEFGE
jgi:hypothetical protein